MEALPFGCREATRCRMSPVLRASHRVSHPAGDLAGEAGPALTPSGTFPVHPGCAPPSPLRVRRPWRPVEGEGRRARRGIEGGDRAVSEGLAAAGPRPGRAGFSAQSNGPLRRSPNRGLPGLDRQSGFGPPIRSVTCFTLLTTVILVLHFTCLTFRTTFHEVGHM